MAVDEIFTMASRSLSIWGSGTFCTSSEVLPIQQLARMTGTPRKSWSREAGIRTAPLPSADCGVRLRGSLSELAEGFRSFRAALGSDDLPGLQDLLQPAEIVSDLLIRLFAEQLRDRRAHRPTGRRILQPDPDLG